MGNVTLPDFSGCLARLDWADAALTEFHRESARWFAQKDATATVAEYYPDANVHAFRVCADAPPRTFGVMISNIVHQARASLDNLVWQLVIANGETPRTGMGGNQFPILTTELGTKSFATRAAKSLSGVHPEHIALLERCQPYLRLGGRDPAKQHPLGILARWSNRDKHQVLDVVAAGQHPTARWAINFTGGFESRLDAGLLPNDRLSRGSIIAWAQFEPPGHYEDAELHMIVALTFRMRIGDGSSDPPLNLMIGPELRFILANVRGIVDAFRPLENGDALAGLRFDFEDQVARYWSHYNSSPEGQEANPVQHLLDADPQMPLNPSQKA